MSSSEQCHKIRFVCISDTHNHAPGEGYTLPKGDVLVHAGDLTNQGSHAELQKTASWLEMADFAVKIVVGGNHDLSLDSDYGILLHDEGWNVAPDGITQKQCQELVKSIPGVVYLQHESAEIELPGKGISFRVFGSPYSPHRPAKKQNWAFQYSDEQATTLWDAVPDDTDLLITHTPPAGHCDASRHWDEGGCRHLTQVLGRVRPSLHIFGHCHEGRGAEVVRWAGADSPSGSSVESVRAWQDPGAGGNKKQSLLDLTGTREGGRRLEVGKETAVVNASVMARSWGRGGKAFNKPIVVDMDLPVRG